MHEIDFEGSLKFLTLSKEDKNLVLIFNGAYNHRNISEDFDTEAKFGGFVKNKVIDGKGTFVPESWSSSLKIGSNGQDDILYSEVKHGVILCGGVVLLCNDIELLKETINIEILEVFDVSESEDDRLAVKVSSERHDHIRQKLNSIYG